MTYLDVPGPQKELSSTMISAAFCFVTGYAPVAQHRLTQMMPAQPPPAQFAAGGPPPQPVPVDALTHLLACCF